MIFVRNIVKAVLLVMDNFGALLTFLIMVVTFIEVLMRYVLSVPDLWSDALATHAYAWLTLVGATAAVLNDRNLGVRYFRDRIHPDWLRKVVELLCTLVIAGFGYLLTKSAILLIQAQASGQIGGINLTYGVVYSVIVAAGVLMVIFSLVQIVSLIMNIKVETS